VALTTILIIGGGLLAKSLWNVVQTAPGFSSDNRLALRVFPVGKGYQSLTAHRNFVGAVLAGAEALPGVLEIVAASHVPLGDSGSSVVRTLPEGGRMPVAQAPMADYRAVSSGYFRLMSIPLLKGRQFTGHDNENAPDVIIVNARLAKELWPDEDPIGKQVRWLDQDSDTGLHTVVGVVGDVKQFGLEKDDHPAAYAPYSQLKFPWLRWMNVVVRSDRDAAKLVAPMRGIIRSIDPSLPVFEVSTLEHRLQVSLAPRRFLLVLMASLSGLALLLGLVGTYGVVSYLVLQRRAEFAIRIALGATNRDLVRLVLSRGVVLTGWGLLAGLAASVALSRYVQHLLFGVTANDPVVMVSASAVVLSVGLLACIVPALTLGATIHSAAHSMFCGLQFIRLRAIVLVCNSFGHALTFWGFQFIRLRVQCFGVAIPGSPARKQGDPCPYEEKALLASLRRQ
jgi:putative ABC transport system permease protein